MTKPAPEKPTYEALEKRVAALEQVQEELKRVRKRLAGVTEMARLAYWEHDILRDIYTFNDQFYKIFRTTADQVGGYTMSSEQYLRKFMHPDDLPRLLAEVRKTRESGYSRPDRQIEHRVVFPDGTIGHVSVSFFQVVNAEGVPVKAYGVTQDITERKRAETALKDEITRRRILVEQSKDGIIVVDRNAKVIESNQQFASMIGYSLEETLKLHVWDWDVLSTRETLLAQLERVDAAGIHHETRHRRKDGSFIDVEISANGLIYGDQKLIFAVHRDITARKQAERERQSNLKFFESMDRVNRAITKGKNDVEDAMKNVLDVVLSLFACDRAFLLAPCDPEAPFYRVPMERNTPEYPGIGNPLFKIHRTPESAKIMRALRDSDGPLAFGPDAPRPLTGDIAERYGVRSLMAMVIYPKTDEPWEFGIQQCAGPRIWSMEETTLFQEIGRRFSNMITSLLADRDLRKSEEFLSRIVENIPDTIIVKAADTLKFVRINRAGERMMGRPREELIGRSSSDLLPDREAAVFNAKDRAVLKAGQLVDISEEIVRNLNGEQRILRSKVMPLSDENGTPQYLLSISEDITELKRLQSQLLQSQKLEAIGAMSGGIAHDFNNILQPMVGFCELLMEDLPAGSPQQTFVEGILAAASRAKEMVNQILAFSRRTDREVAPVRIQQILNEVIKLGRSIIPSNIDIRQDIQDDCGAVLADPTQMHQIAMNLMINAYHAMESGGEISIRLEETTIRKGDFADPDLEPGRYALLSIADTGSGISPAVMDRIFDPYFTTKGQGKGSGLGLSVVYGIVKEHRGHITVSSRLGKGTRFDIYLPLSEATTISSEVETTAKRHATGSEHILLVDDEEMVITPEKMILERLGYRVTTRLSGIDALETFREDPDAFDLVITDMTMPKMTGDLLAREIVALRPRVPVIICTGFNEKINPQVAKPPGVRDFFMKPVSISEMAAKVRRVLDESGRK